MSSEMFRDQELTLRDWPAGLGNFGLRLFHPQDASLMLPVGGWAVCVLAAPAAWREAIS
jgi:hypothetical protein